MGLSEQRLNGPSHLITAPYIYQNDTLSVIEVQTCMAFRVAVSEPLPCFEHGSSSDYVRSEAYLSRSVNPFCGIRLLGAIHEKDTDMVIPYEVLNDWNDLERRRD